MTEVMFWRANEAVAIGTTSKWMFQSRKEAEAFVSAMTVPHCDAVSFRENGGEYEYFEVEA